jgi:hypothetical protein
VQDGCSSGEGRFYLARGLRERGHPSRIQGTTEVAQTQTTELSFLSLLIAFAQAEIGPSVEKANSFLRESPFDFWAHWPSDVKDGEAAEGYP